MNHATMSRLIRPFLPALILAVSGCLAIASPPAKDIPGEVMVLDAAESAEPWNTKALDGNSTGVVIETEIVREGDAAVRWKSAGIERERFGFAVPPDKQDWTGYDQVQFWMYSGKHNRASIRPTVMTDNKHYRTSLYVVWEGWRLVNVPLKRFGDDWSWGDVEDFGKNPALNSVRAFGFEEHSVKHMGFEPKLDSDIVIDAVVLSKKILDGELVNEIGPQSNPFVYTCRLKNLTDVARRVKLTELQQRGANLASEVVVSIEPAEFVLLPGASATAKVTISATPEQLASPHKLRELDVSILATVNDQAVPQLEFRIPCRRLYFDSLKLDHPRLYCDDEKLAEIKKLVETDDLAAEWWNKIRKEADELAGKEMASRGGRSGLDPIKPLSFAYRMTGDVKYAEKVREYVQWALGWEEHNQGRKANWPRMTNLASGHNALNLGIAYDWLYDFWPVAERAALRNKIVDKSLNAHYDDCMVRHAWGHSYASNWSSVVSGGTGVAALAILGDAPDASRDVEFATERMERICEAQGIDGASTEGTSYWNYHMRYAGWFTDALRTVTGGTYNLYRLQPFFYKTCYYYVGMHLPEGQRVNFAADAWHNGHYTGPVANPTYHPHYLRMASEFKDGYLQWKALNSQDPLASLLWYDPSVKPKPGETRPLAQFYRGLQYAIMRSSNDSVDDVALAIRAGNNSEDHGQFDVMNFVLSGHGYQLAADYWPSKYSADGYFGFTRHLNKRAATFGHNCILLDGQSQIWGLGTEAKFNEYFHSDAADYLVADGSKIYSPEVLSKWKRHVLFVRPNYFIMWDEIASPKPVTIEWRMMTRNEESFPPETTEHGAVATSWAQKKFPGKAAQLKIAHVASPVRHTTLIDRFAYDSKIDNKPADKRGNFFLKTMANEKTDNWTLLTMMFPVNRVASKGRGEFEPIRAKGLLGARISDVRDLAGPDVVLVNLAGGDANAAGVSFSGRAALVSGAESPTRYVLILGTKLTSGQTELLTSDVPVIAAIALRDDTWVGSIQSRQDATVKLYTGMFEKVRLKINGKSVRAKAVNGYVEIAVPASDIDEFLASQGDRVGEQTYE